MKTGAIQAAPVMYEVTEAAARMGIDRSQVYAMIAAGELDWVNAAVTPNARRKRIRITDDAIADFIARRTQPARKARRAA